MQNFSFITVPLCANILIDVISAILGFSSKGAVTKLAPLFKTLCEGVICLSILYFWYQDAWTSHNKSLLLITDDRLTFYRMWDDGMLLETRGEGGITMDHTTLNLYSSSDFHLLVLKQILLVSIIEVTHVFYCQIGHHSYNVKWWGELNPL
mgnify:CR=1 FL=1